MTIHITVDGADTETYSTLLSEHYKNNNYNVRLINRPSQNHTHILKKDFQLSNHEIALIHCLDDSITYYCEDWINYDLVIWNKSVIDDYIKLLDDNVSGYWLKLIHKNNHKKDYHLYIKPEKQPVKTTLFNNFKPLLILNETDGYEHNLNKTINQINNTFPHCQWCNHIYKKDRHHYKYCSNTCRQLSREKQNRDNFNNYYRKYRNVLSPHEKGTLGSKNALLKQHPSDDFEKEHLLIQKEKHRQGIK